METALKVTLRQGLDDTDWNLHTVRSSILVVEVGGAYSRASENTDFIFFGNLPVLPS
jgi:hypothetical protein